MCYCCRKLEIWVFSMYFMCLWGRFSDSQIWEAVCVRGRAPLIGSDRSDHITEPIRGAWPLTHTASQIWESENRPHKHTASQHLSCDLSEPIRGARPLTHTASQICEAVGVRGADRPLTHTGRSNAFSREISQAAPRIGLHRPVCVRVRSSGLSDWFHG